MNILILTYLVYPFQSPRSFRSSELAIELAKKGHNVVMYAALGQNEKELISKKYFKERNVILKNYKKTWFLKNSNLENNKENILNKILIKLFHRLFYFPNIELLFIIPKSLKFENNYDLLISIASPHSVHWGAKRALKKNTNLTKKWIADCGDPFMGNKILNPPLYFSPFENSFLKKVDYVSVPIEEAKKSYNVKYQKKIHVIPQGFNFENIKLYKKDINNKLPTFAYSGVIYNDYRDPTNFLKYLSEYKGDFKFIVYTKQTAYFNQFKKTLKDKLVIKNYIPRDELLYELSKMDFLINFENVYSNQLPSKLIDYALTKRPILSINNNDLNKEQIDNFIKGSYNDSIKINTSKYNIKIIAESFINLALYGKIK
ncbi:MAG: hypothetical protein VB079_00550 [Petrimonas sp.]|nr:hypothetical protein [Petrimonas sp.]MEA5080302.1 hypothetical protein [Dysgonamonadaceae bacterium]